jgi:N-carbamoyl-L-amino-acid hydrolase
LERGGVTLEGILSARRNPASLAGYLELHIEQGPRLANTGVDIGVVSGIVGIASIRMIFTGQSDHAGATPMDSRQDAGLGASAFQLAARQIVMQQFPGCVMNVGAVSYEPGAFNIVPAKAQLSLEFRSPDAEQLRDLETALLDQAHRTAQDYGLGVIFELLNRHQPAPLSQEVQQAIFTEAAGLGLTTISMPSGAGHDAQSLASLCPAGMIFVPSIGGASHSNREFTRWEDCLNGANVLLQTALRMAG